MSLTLTLPLDVPVRPMDAKGLKKIFSTAEIITRLTGKIGTNLPVVEGLKDGFLPTQNPCFPKGLSRLLGCFRVFPLSIIIADEWKVFFS